MAKEIRLYSQMYDFIVDTLMGQLDENQGENVTLRVNSPGGSVFAGWGLVAKIKEHTGSMLVKCDGLVASMALYMLLFCDDVEALDVTTFVLHRADMYVGDPEDQAFLDNVNAQLKDKLTKMVDVKMLKELKGVTIADIFNPDQRIDVRMTAAEAKKIGLINRVVKLTPAVRAEMKADLDKWYGVAATIEPIQKPNTEKMTIAELQAKHPELYASIFALGVKKENDRIGGFLPFAEIDPKGVVEAIKKGEDMTPAQMSEFTIKAFSAKSLTDLSKQAPAAVLTEEQKLEKEKTDKAAGVTAFEKEVRKNLGLKD